MARNPTGQSDVRQVTEQLMDESRENKDDFYAFSARSREAQNTVAVSYTHLTLPTKLEV